MQCNARQFNIYFLTDIRVTAIVSQWRCTDSTRQCTAVQHLLPHWHTGDCYSESVKVYGQYKTMHGSSTFTSSLTYGWLPWWVKVYGQYKTLHGSSTFTSSVTYGRLPWWVKVHYSALQCTAIQHLVPHCHTGVKVHGQHKTMHSDSILILLPHWRTGDRHGEWKCTDSTLQCTVIH